jgi:hypothetical protein
VLKFQQKICRFLLESVKSRRTLLTNGNALERQISRMPLATGESHNGCGMHSSRHQLSTHKTGQEQHTLCRAVQLLQAAQHKRAFLWDRSRMQ